MMDMYSCLSIMPTYTCILNLSACVLKLCPVFLSGKGARGCGSLFSEGGWKHGGGTCQDAPAGPVCSTVSAAASTHYNPASLFLRKFLFKQKQSI